MLVKWDRNPSPCLPERATLSKHNILTAYDVPETPEDVSRRTFMANATLTIGGIIGLVLAVPIVSSLIPTGQGTKGTWSPLTTQEWNDLLDFVAPDVPPTVCPVTPHDRG